MQLRADIEIERPAAEVFAYLSDFSNNPRWQSGMESASWTSEPPHTVGATYVQVARFLGREIRSHFVVEALEPGRSVRIATTESTFPIRVERSVEPLDASRCRVRADIQGDPATGLMRLVAPLMRWFGQRSVTADYQALKVLLEG